MSTLRLTPDFTWLSVLTECNIPNFFKNSIYAWHSLFGKAATEMATLHLPQVPLTKSWMLDRRRATSHIESSYSSTEHDWLHPSNISPPWPRNSSSTQAKLLPCLALSVCELLKFPFPIMSWISSTHPTSTYFSANSPTLLDMSIIQKIPMPCAETVGQLGRACGTSEFLHARSVSCAHIPSAQLPSAFLSLPVHQWIVSQSGAEVLLVLITSSETLTSLKQLKSPQPLQLSR
jgi:hypothetical protein